LCFKYFAVAPHTDLSKTLINRRVFFPIVITQSKDRKKISSGIKQLHRKKRLYEKGGRPTLTRIGEKEIRFDRIRAGGTKLRILRTDIANIYNSKEKKFQKAAIKNVAENPANRHYARANIMTKGSIVETELGKARITNRPGQEGIINGVLIVEAEKNKQ